MFYAHLFLAVAMLFTAIVNFFVEDWLMATACLLICIANVNQL